MTERRKRTAPLFQWVEVPGRYERRKIAGRWHRVHHKGYRYRRWLYPPEIIEAILAIRLGLAPAPEAPKKAPPKKAPPKKAPPKKAPPKKAPPKPPSGILPPDWITLREHLDEIAAECEEEEDDAALEEGAEWEGIFRQDQDTDVVDRNAYHFIWPRRLRVLTVKALGGSEIPLVRVWFLLYNMKKRRFFVWSRARSIGVAGKAGYAPKTIQEALEHVRDIEQGVTDSVAELDYLEFRKTIGWSAWLAGEKLTD